MPATCQSSTSLSINPNKDAEGFPSWWRVPLLPGLLDTPSQVCLPLHDTLLPLSHFIHEWECLPGVSLWVLRMIRSSYTLQFGSNPPRFDGVQLTVVNSASKASVLQLELSSLLAIEEIPQSDIERGFYSRFFLVPKRDGGLRPILDLRRLNFYLYKGKFKMLTKKTIMSQIQGGDWFVTIDLQDAYSTSRSFSDTEGSFGLPSERRLTNTRSFPSAWPWRREHSRNAWMQRWPL